MEVPVSPQGSKRRDVSSEVPASKRSSSGDGGQWSDITDWTDWSESDFSIPTTGDSPPSQKLPNQSNHHLPNQLNHHLPDQLNHHLPDQSNQHLPNQLDHHLPDQLNQYGAVDEHEPESFYGLPIEMKTLLKKYRDIEELYEWQSRLMDRLIKCHMNVIYSVPTSGGKTLVAELMLIRELLLHKRNALLVLPYVSIVQEKLRSMYPFAEKLGFMIEEFAGSRGQLPLRMRRKMKTLYIATIEKANLVVMSLLEMNKFDTLGLVVIDELHMIGDGSVRGAILESLIIKCKLASFKHNPSCRMLGMSATLSNFGHLAVFMEAEVVKDQFRPVELKEYVKLDRVLYDATEVTGKKLSYEDMKLLKRFPPDHNDGDDLVSLVSEVVPEKSCLVFCPTKKHCENTALFLVRELGKKKRLRAGLVREKVRAMEAIRESNEGAICPILLQTIPSGIAYHHSGLTPDEREVIESSFLKGIISCIVCTSTLAAGVNLPAERVIIREARVGRDFLSKAQYQQMCGRAGRAGMTESGLSILMASSRDHEKVKELIESPVPSCKGVLLDLPNDLSALLLNLVHSKLATSVEELMDTIQKNSFSALQHSSDVVREVTEKAIQELFDRKLVEKVDKWMTVTGDGRGVVKSLIGVDRCGEIQSDLLRATNALSVRNHLHLIFICTSLFEENELPLDVDSWLLFESFMDLSQDEKMSARVIEMSESVISRARDTGRCDHRLKRFFVTLLVYDAYQHRMDIDTLSRRYGMQRGVVHSLLNQVASHASSLFRFVEEKKENLWAFVSLLPEMCIRLTYCCNPELVPLLQLPGVKLSRAKQLLHAGFKDIVTIAKSKDRDMVSKIDKLNLFQARRIIKSARHIVLGLKDELEEQVLSMELNESSNVLDVSNSVIDDPFGH